MKVYVSAMSMRRGDLQDYVEAHTRQVIIALAQLYLFPSGPRVHWRKGVWEKFNEMHTLKPMKKLPSAKFILDNSFEIYKNRLVDMLQYAIDKEEKYAPIGNVDDYEFRVLVHDYFIWLANMFSSQELIRKSDVYQELDRLGLTEQYFKE